jgi:acetyl esterase
MSNAPNPPLDPVIEAFERRWKESGIPGLYEGSGPEMRERARCIRALLYPKPTLPAGLIEAIEIAGDKGAPPIPCRVIWPHDPRGNTPKKAEATLVYYHGGGFILGDLDSHEMHAVRIANATGAVVINVGYRLAPEDQFPAGIDDAWTALRWVHANLDRFGGSGQPLAVGGDSAGGNFAAVMSILARDAGMELAAQLLIYPATNMTGPTDAVKDIYLGPNVDTLAPDFRASPLRAVSLAGLAPAIIGVGPYDFLYRDNLAYHAALVAAGNDVLLREFPTLNHGFFSYTAVSKDSEVAADQLCADLKSLFARARARSQTAEA